MLRTFLIRSDERSAFSVLSSGTTVWTNTKETSPTETQVPTPTLMFGVKSTRVIASVQSIVAPRASLKASDSASGEATTEAASRGSSEADGTPSASDDGEAGFPKDRPATSLAAPRPIPSPVIEKRPTRQAEASKIDLTIDSLPNLELIETIPITIVQLGDKLFTATVNALRLSGTGSTLSESVVTVKEERVDLYERLTKRQKLDEQEKNDLQYLQSHIKLSGISKGPFAKITQEWRK